MALASAYHYRLPEMFPGPLGDSLAGRALEDGLWSLTTHDLREFGIGKHQKH